MQIKADLNEIRNAIARYTDDPIKLTVNDICLLASLMPEMDEVTFFELAASRAEAQAGTTKQVEQLSATEICLVASKMEDPLKGPGWMLGQLLAKRAALLEAIAKQYWEVGDIFVLSQEKGCSPRELFLEALKDAKSELLRIEEELIKIALQELSEDNKENQEPKPKDVDKKGK